MRKLTIILSVSVSVLFAGLLGYIYYLEYGLWVIAVCAAMVLAFPFSVVMHELGHVIIGACCKIKAVPKFGIFSSSLCKLIPKTHKNLKVRVYLTAVGGIFVNALFFILGMFALWFKACPVWLTLFMPANIYLFIMNDMPVMFPEGKTDGLVAWEILNGSDEAKVMLAVLGVQARILNGEKIEDIDEASLFGLPQIREDDMSFIALTDLRYRYFKAKGMEEEAEIYKKRFESLKDYID